MPRATCHPAYVYASCARFWHSFFSDRAEGITRQIILPFSLHTILLLLLLLYASIVLSLSLTLSSPPMGVCVSLSVSVSVCLSVCLSVSLCIQNISAVYYLCIKYSQTSFLGIIFLISQTIPFDTSFHLHKPGCFCTCVSSSYTLLSELKTLPWSVEGSALDFMSSLP